jgi:fluoride ion exporter CrcB/FEX
MVVGHTPKGALVSMVAAALSFTPKRIYYRHGLIYTTCKGLKRFILKTEERFVSLLATKIVNVSPSLAALATKEQLNNKQKQLLIGAGTCGGIDAINTFNPETVIVGGNLALAGEYLMLPLKSSTSKYSLNLVYKDTKFRVSKMTDSANAWGVAMLIRNKIIGL